MRTWIVIEGKGTLRLGLNLPLFIAAMVTIGASTLVGMMGVWGAAAWGRPVPEWVKVGHSHSSWWAVLIIIAAMVLPSLNLKTWAKRLIIAGTFIGPTFWTGVLATYYEIGGPAIWRMESPITPGTYYELPLLGLVAAIFEFLGFVALGIVGLSAAGIRVPLISTHEPPQRSRYEILSDIEVPRRVFLIPVLAIALSVIVGFGITILFKVTHTPVSPAALVQLHDHSAIIAVSSLTVLLLMSVLNANERIQRIAYRLMLISVPLTIAGLFAFNFIGLHSIVWVAPAGIYYLLILLMIPVALGYFSQRSSSGEHKIQGPHVPAFRWGLAVIYAGLALSIAMGAVVALLWNTNPNVTVTYRQPEGSPYPGPYPAVYLGSAPARGTPRGFELAHLSPGSWYHVGAVWMMVLMVFGPTLIGNRPGLLVLLAVIIPLAPLFNLLTRYLAWLGIPNAAGALWFAGQPLFGFSIVALFIIGVVAVYLVSRGKRQL